MHEVIASKAWLGHAHDIRDARTLYDAGIQVVIDVAMEETPAKLPRDLVYLRFPLNDGGGNAGAVIKLAIQTTLEILKSELPCIVACSAGMSRSPTLLSFAMGLESGQPPLEALQQIGQLKPVAVNQTLWADFSKQASSIVA